MEDFRYFIKHPPKDENLDEIMEEQRQDYLDELNEEKEEIKQKRQKESK